MNQRNGNTINMRLPVFQNVAPFSFRARVLMATAVTAGPVTVGHLRSIMVVGSASTTSVEIINTVRLKSVALYAPALSGDDENSFCDISFTGSHTSEALTVSNAIESIPSAIIRNVPPKSVASMWQQPGSDSDVLFTVTCPAGAMLDLSMSVVFYHDGSVNSGPGGTGLTLGEMYYGLIIGSTVHPLEGMNPFTL